MKHLFSILLIALSLSAQAQQGQLYAYWLAVETGRVPSAQEVIQRGTRIQITHGQPLIQFDIRTLEKDQFIFLVEPASEPIKSVKIGSATDMEPLGLQGQFNWGLVSEGLRYYRSNAKTANTSSTIKLKVKS